MGNKEVGFEGSTPNDAIRNALRREEPTQRPLFGADVVVLQVPTTPTEENPGEGEI